jgi:hypothetical protein
VKACDDVIVWCSLRNNAISAEAFRGASGLGLARLTQLETLDFSENNLELSVAMNRRQFFDVISQLPNLRMIGLGGLWDQNSRHRCVYGSCRVFRTLPARAVLCGCDGGVPVVPLAMPILPSRAVSVTCLRLARVRELRRENHSAAKAEEESYLKDTRDQRIFFIRVLQSMHLPHAKLR